LKRNAKSWQKCKILTLSPGCSENPFLFFFKKEKIVTKNGTIIPKMPNLSAPKK
jgi:hypothetical protein